MDETALRRQLHQLLDWHDAHVGFDAAVKGIPARLRGVVPKGLPHSAWQLVEHIRLAQADILEFCERAKYREKKWPEDYWPTSPVPKRSTDWVASIAAFRRDRRSLQRLAANRDVDLFAAIPHGTGQTCLRELLLVADHTSYHVGQIVVLRRALNIWGGS